MIGPVKLLIVDDHAIVREGLAALLRQLGPDVVVLQARDVPQGLDVLGRHPDLDLVLLDLTLPGIGGLAAIKEFGARQPGLAVMILSSSEDPEDVRRALSLGALGYVPKSANPQTLLSALQLVLAGDIYVPPLMMAAVRATAAEPTAAEASWRLTPRQLDVLRLLSGGMSNKEIGSALDLSDKTVKAHITAIFRALNVVNRTQAASAARRLRLL